MKLRPGDRVQLKGPGLDGYSGTVVRLDELGHVVVRFDEGQRHGGHRAISVTASSVGRVER